ncbi:MAG TPA: LysM peptidoglycan-binding domain-containing protein [Micromonosporaceae bacterium]
MSVSTWAPARNITDDAVHIHPEVARAPGGRVAVVGRRGRGGVAARERFSGVSRPALRLVPPLPAVAAWPTGVDRRTGAIPTSDRDMVSEPEDEPTGPTGPTLDSGVARASAKAVLSDSSLARPSIPTQPSDRSSAVLIPIRSVSSPARARSAHAPVRLTRRGRLVLAGLLLVFAAAMVGTLASTVEAAAPSGPPRAVVVHPGDTLWSIAARVHPRGSLTDTMLTIERLNHMPDGTVYVGQQLLLPNS